MAVVGLARGTEQQEGGESELHVLQGSGKDTSCGYTGGSHPVVATLEGATHEDCLEGEI